MKQADLMNLFKKVSKTVCTSAIVVSPDPLSAAPPTASTVKTPEDPDDPEPAEEGDSQVEYSSD
jgi:hypothetical protein